MARLWERSPILRWFTFGIGLIIVAAFNLRPTITSVGPLLPEIGADLGLDEGMQGLLGTLPLLTFAVVSPLVFKLTSRLGIERTMFFALLVLTLGTVTRSFLGVPGLWLGTVLLGAAIGVGNVLVPVVVQRDYPLRVSQVTGIYASVITVVASIASVIAVPVAGWVGWGGSLAIWAVPALVAALCWLPRARAAAPQAPHRTAARTEARAQSAVATPAGEQSETTVTEPTGPIWKRLDAWLVTLFMGLQSVFFFSTITWLPTIEITNGVSEERAGVHLFLFIIIALVATLLLPRIMHDPERLTLAGLCSSVPLLLMALGYLIAPSWGIVWSLIGGLGAGACLVFALSLISIRSRTTNETTRMGGMVQSIGYLLSATGPIGIGILAQVTSGWTLPLVALGAITVALIPITVLLGKSRSPRE